MMHWIKFKRLLSAYRDHELPSARFRALWRHLYHCAECREELEQFESMGTALRELPTPAMPADLPFRVRLRLSQERSRRQAPGWRWRLATRLGPLALPGGAGMLSALLLFGVFLPEVSAPMETRAVDTPLMLSTPARLRGTGPIELVTNTEELMVQVLVDQEGRVADYDIVAGNYTAEDVRDLRSRLLFTVFDPATVFGKPQPETLLLSFRSVRVRG
jgi:anti-sigma factor RsiW